MSEELPVPSGILSPEEVMAQIDNIDLSKVETAFPLLASGAVKTTIIACEWRRDTEKKGDEAKPYIYVEYDLAQPWKTAIRDGIPSKAVNPGDRGSKFNERIYVGTYEDKKTGEMKWYGIERYAQLREAALGRAPEGSKINPPELIGQSVTTNLKFEPAPVNKDTKEVMGPRTTVIGYVRKKTTS